MNLRSSQLSHFYSQVAWSRILLNVKEAKTEVFSPDNGAQTQKLCRATQKPAKEVPMIKGYAPFAGPIPVDRHGHPVNRCGDFSTFQGLWISSYTCLTHYFIANLQPLGNVWISTYDWSIIFTELFLKYARNARDDSLFFSPTTTHFIIFHHILDTLRYRMCTFLEKVRLFTPIAALLLKCLGFPEEIR